MSPFVLYPALFAAGLVSGALNVVAGGGSFLVLPLLIFAGLPPTVANGTNRVAILVQNVGAVWSFDRYRVLDRTLAIIEAAGFGKAAAEEPCRSAARELGLKEGDFFMVLRVAVTGRTASPPLFETMEVLGKDESVARLKQARAKL